MATITQDQQAFAYCLLCPKLAPRSSWQLSRRFSDPRLRTSELKADSEVVKDMGQPSTTHPLSSKRIAILG